MAGKSGILVPETITPGSTLGFRQLSDVQNFEDAVIAPLVVAHFDTDSWDMRDSIRDIVWPDPKIFQGRLHDITLTVHEDPIDTMRTARDERSRRFGQVAGKLLQKLVRREEEALSGCLGVTLRAMASSSKRANIGEVEVDIWYVPGESVEQEQEDTSMPRRIHRIPTLPEYDKNAFKAVHKSSTRMGAVAATAGRTSMFERTSPLLEKE